MSPDDEPFCRASIRGGRITLNPWSRALSSRGPARDGARHVRAVLLDVYRTGEDDGELIVAEAGGRPLDDGAEATLVDWATAAGYARVWLPGRVVDLAGALAPCGRARVTCPTCAARWSDGGPDFWRAVRRRGWFPSSCLSCGGSLPEWEVEAVDGPAAGTAAGPGRRRPAGHRRR